MCEGLLLFVEDIVEMFLILDNVYPLSFQLSDINKLPYYL